MQNVEQIILAGDHTAWSRPEAVTLQERTTEHYTTGGGGNRPITQGQGYSTIAWIPETQGSWALPLRHERITSWESPIEKAVWQLSQGKPASTTTANLFMGSASMVALRLS